MAAQLVRTGVGRAVGQRQVGASPPGPGAEVLLASAAVGARGVMLTLALQAALTHGAQVGVQVALAPGGTQRGRDVSTLLGRWQGPGRLWGLLAWKESWRPQGQPATTHLQDKKNSNFPPIAGTTPVAFFPRMNAGPGLAAVRVGDQMSLSQMLCFSNTAP